MRSVSSENGTAGKPGMGNESGSRPWSPAVGTSMWPVITSALTTVIATSGEGTAVAAPFVGCP